MGMLGEAKRKIEEEVDKLETQEFAGCKIGSFSKDLLIIGDDVTEHLKMQPAAIAYFGMLVKRADEMVRAAERRFDEWQRTAYQKANEELMGERTTKPTKDDINARVLIKYRDKYSLLRDRIEKAKSIYSTLEIWMEAFRQKGFSMDKLCSFIKEEMLTDDGVRAKVGKLLKRGQ